MNGTPPDLGGLDLSDPAFRADPYSTYERLRADAPVSRNDAMGYWLLTTYDDVAAALRRPELYSSASFDDRPVSRHDASNYEHRRLLEAFGSTMIFQDPPIHTRLRKLVNKPFTPASINRRREELVDLCRSLLLAGRELGDFDFVGHFAAPFPILVIAQLLGVPVRDRGLIKDLSYQFGILFEPMLPTDQRYAALDASVRLGDYLDDAVEARRRQAGDDIISALLAVQEDGDRLTGDELRGMLLHMLVAGNETSTSLMTHAMLVFEEQPSVRASVQRGEVSAGECVVEVLRYDPPLQMVTRQVTEDVSVRGVTIPRGDLVGLVIGSANRDEDKFHRADVFNASRPNNSQHLAFGAGPHFCLGSILSRLEGEIATELLVTEFADLRVEPSRGVRRPDQMIRGYLKLPARYVE